MEKIRNLEEFNQRYRGQIGLILASGPSLCQHLSFLKSIPYKWATLAVNSSIIACPDADFFISDDHDVCNWSYFHNLKDSKTTMLLYEDKLGHTTHAFGDRAVLYRHRKGEYITDYYDHNCYDFRIGEGRSSVFSAIHIAHIMGCKCIMILGLDGCRSGKYRWFWQLPSWENKPKRTDGKRGDKYRCYIDGQNILDSDLMDISRYWEERGPDINKKCLVYNGSVNSVINVFPYIPLNEFVEKYHV